MASEKEVKEGTAAPVCSVTLRRCDCGDSGRCQSRRDSMVVDNASTQTVLLIRTAGVYLETVIETLMEAGGTMIHRRAYPAPEVRQIILDLSKIRSDLRNISKGFI